MAEARASHEVRFSNPDAPVLLLADDGIMGERFVYGIDAEGRPITHRISQDPQALLSISENDLVDWLARNFSSTAPVASIEKSHFSGDAALIEEGRRLVSKGVPKREAARQLVDRAEGSGTIESKIDRLRRAF
jgi:hypothetical protein